MKHLISFDLDGTLTTENSWFLLNKAMGLTQEEDSELFNDYLSGKISYDEWIDLIVSIYKNKKGDLSKDQVEQIANSINIREGAFEVVKKLKSMGHEVIMISGSTDVICNQIAQKLNIDTYLSASKIIFDNENKITDIYSMGDERGAKMKLLKDYCKKNNYSLDMVVAIGDGGNDLEIFENVKGILIGENSELSNVAWKKISKLSEIPSILN